MKHDDLTPDEQEALQLLWENAPEAPEVLASLGEDGRARVLGALSSAGTSADDSDDSVVAVTDESPDDETEDEPVLDSAPESQSSSPSTLADRLLAQNVTVAGKRVPVIPSSVAVVLVIVTVILLVRACGGNGNPLEALADRGMEAVDSLDDAADEVGDDRLFNAADRVRDDMRTLMSEADADHSDFDESLDAGEAVAELGTAITGFVEVAADSAQRGGEENARAAADAARIAARLVTNNEVLDQAETFAERLLDTHIKENARRADSEEVAEFRRSVGDLIDATRKLLIADVNFHLARADLSVEISEGMSIDDANDALDEARDTAIAASEDYDQAVDDFCFFEVRVDWRGGGEFPWCEWESPPFFLSRW